MQPIIQLSIALLAVLTLSACGIQNKPTPKQEQSQKTTATTTEVVDNPTTSNEPFFTPLFSEFHMGPIMPEQDSPDAMRFPVVSRKIGSVYVKAYKVSKESFITLLKQHPGWAKHEGKLDLSSLNTIEKKPFFEGEVKINETGPITSIPLWSTLSETDSLQMKGYINIPLVQTDGTTLNQGYYYFEFEAPESTEAKILNSLLEITETRAGYSEQYSHY